MGKKKTGWRSFGIGRQVFLLSLGLVLLTVLTMGAFVIQGQKDQVKADAIRSMGEMLNLESAMFDSKYPGDWEVKDGKLFKGGTLMNDNNEVMDTVAATSGHLATLFFNDTRIATSVKDASGKRLTGTKASSQIVDEVLVKGNNHYGDAKVADLTIFSAYKPIKAKDGSTIGMLFLGDPKLKNVVDNSWKDSLHEILLIELVVVVLAGLFSYLYTRRITRRLSRIEDKLEHVTEGDLTTASLPAGRRDEVDRLTHSVNQMNEDLHQIVSSISDVSHQVAASSEELSAIAQETSASTEHVGSLTENLADGSEKQTALVRRTSDTLATMADEIVQMSKLSADAVESMQLAAQEANRSYEAGSEVLRQMQEVMKSTDQTFRSIGQLAERSGEIGGIAQIMSNLSKQTNLLALNAAIEASRAGESGRGFAVVATEIRKLAEQSASSAQQVAEIVKVIQDDTREAKEWITHDREAVIAGTEMTERIIAALGLIQTKVTEVSRKLNEARASVLTVDGGSRELSGMMAEVKSAADQAAEATHQVSATCEEQLAAMEEIASSAMALASLAEQLQTTLGKFRIA
ncbi:methyl-accepting chemotaxis protein [Gorillibacterium sp. sgz500922]|uniref:methyl-accepting chemotaxis protein n=1 Tax=Gorillibacterium sp. sgz500922 TaxID=3446694 RepID=UPI003F67B652